MCVLGGEEPSQGGDQKSLEKGISRGAVGQKKEDDQPAPIAPTDKGNKNRFMCRDRLLADKHRKRFQSKFQATERKEGISAWTGHCIFSRGSQRAGKGKGAPREEKKKCEESPRSQYNSGEITDPSLITVQAKKNQTIRQWTLGKGGESRLRGEKSACETKKRGTYSFAA